MKYLLPICTCLCLALTPSVGFCAKTNYADKAHDIKDALKEKKAEHAALTQKSKELNTEVSSLKKNLVKVSQDLQKSEQTLNGTDQKLKELREKKTALVQNLYKDQKAMGGLVSAIRKYERTSTPDMLMQSDPVDAARASIVMKSVMP
jgi:septal ring factor EnvC (AmiA/AmiB activator)